MDRLTRHYKQLQRAFPVAVDDSYSPLVVPNGNHARPFHRWFHVKEAFSCDLTRKILLDLKLNETNALKLVDPFVGGGTSLISALEWKSEKDGRSLTAFGIECNPFLEFLARTRIDAMQNGGLELADELEDLTSHAAVASANSRSTVERPALSTFANTEFFNRRRLNNLIRIRDVVREGEWSDLATRLALLVVSSLIESIGNLRRDGRALRYVERSHEKSVSSLFRSRMAVVVKDISVDPLVGDVEVVHGDGRQTATHLSPGARADLMLFSPPYPNNIDYTEVYKLEAWLLGFFSTEEEFRAQRHRTLRSHPSIAFGDSAGLGEDEMREIQSVVAPLLESVPTDRYFAQRTRTITGYFQDLYLTLSSAKKVLHRGGAAVIVVGNSLHGARAKPLVIAADLLIARMGELLGYEVSHIIEARRPSRRGAHPYLRESVVVLINS